MDDFNNMAGNLIENAGKWARSRIHVTLRRTASGLELEVEDDGPGIPAEEFERVLRRGERADTSVAGSGLGLAIVNDLADAYAGRVTLAQSSLGGLKAGVSLPDRAAPPR
jgi:signal transduction histidine kinase